VDELLCLSSEGVEPHHLRLRSSLEEGGTTSSLIMSLQPWVMCWGTPDQVHLSRPMLFCFHAGFAGPYTQPLLKVLQCQMCVAVLLLLSECGLWGSQTPSQPREQETSLFSPIPQEVLNSVEEFEVLVYLFFKRWSLLNGALQGALTSDPSSPERGEINTRSGVSPKEVNIWSLI
jgi:hypothetical protein